MGKRWTVAALRAPCRPGCSAVGPGRVLERPGQRRRRAAAARRRALQDSFAIGGTVSGLVGSGLVLQNNGGGDLPVAADGSFTFADAPRHRSGLQRRCPLSTYIAIAVLHRSQRQRQRRERRRRRRRGDVCDRAVLHPRHGFRAHGRRPGAAEQRRQRPADLRRRRVRVRQSPDRRRDVHGDGAHAAERSELRRAQFLRHDPAARTRATSRSRALERIHDRRTRHRSRRLGPDCCSSTAATTCRSSTTARSRSRRLCRAAPRMK